VTAVLWTAILLTILPLPGVVIASITPYGAARHAARQGRTATAARRHANRGGHRSDVATLTTWLNR